MITIEKMIDEKRAVKIEKDEYGCHLLVMNNGFQWSGTAIYSLEVAEAAHQVLGEYIESQKVAP